MATKMLMVLTFLLLSNTLIIITLTSARELQRSQANQNESFGKSSQQHARTDDHGSKGIAYHAPVPVRPPRYGLPPKHSRGCSPAYGCRPYGLPPAPKKRCLIKYRCRGGGPPAP